MHYIIAASYIPICVDQYNSQISVTMLHPVIVRVRMHFDCKLNVQTLSIYKSDLTPLYMFSSQTVRFL